MKKQLESSEIQHGACRFCGQIMSFETSGLAKEDDLNEWAVEKCDCTAAKIYTKRKKSVNTAKERVNTFFSNISGPSGETAIRLLNEAIDAIIQNEIEQITINIGDGCKGKVSTNSKGNIKVERTDTKKVKYEQ